MLISDTSMNRLLSLSSALLILTSPAQSAVSEILLENWAGFTLDVDNDGVPDFAGTTSNLQNVSLTSYADGNPFTFQTIPGARPGQGTVGSAWQFANLNELKADAIYAGEITVLTPVFGDLHMSEGAPVVLNANKAKPIWAGWRFGTLGSTNDPLSIIGFVLDATDFFASGGSSPVKLHTHHYGNLSPGESLSVSLATALGEEGPDSSPSPSPREGPLSVNFTPTGPGAGQLTVDSIEGLTYELLRSTDLITKTPIESKPGTGGSLTFSFDESATSLARAFFFIRESSP